MAAKTGSYGVPQSYTHCYWVFWNQLNQEKAMLSDGNSYDISASSQGVLGMRTSKSEWKSAGTRIDMTKWNFVCVIGEAEDAASVKGTSTFYLATLGETKVKQQGNTIDRVISGKSVLSIGDVRTGVAKGPGHLAMAEGWSRKLSLLELNAVFSKTSAHVQVGGSGVTLSTSETKAGATRVTIENTAGMEVGDYVVISDGLKDERKVIGGVSQTQTSLLQMETESASGNQEAALVFSSPMKSVFSPRTRVTTYKVPEFVNKPVVWLVADDFEVEFNYWPNRGSGEGITSPRKSGTVVKEAGAGSGAEVGLFYLRGDEKTQLSFGKIANFDSITMCALTRYASSKQGRILNGGGNWLFGHGGGKAGIVRVPGGMSTPDADKLASKWVVTCARSGGEAGDILVGPSSSEKVGSGEKFAKPKDGEITVNLKPNAGVEENSGFAISELIIWNNDRKENLLEGFSYLKGMLKRGRKGKPSNCWLRQEPTSVPLHWFVADDYTESTDSWPNRGAGSDLKDVVRSGTITKVANRNGGAGESIFQLAGTKDTRLWFGEILTETVFTICAMTRYTNGQKKRILAGGGDWAFGHDNGKVGVFKSSSAGWATNTGNKMSKTDSWLIMCARNGGGSGSVVLGRNSIQQGHHAKIPTGGLIGINQDDSSKFNGGAALASDFAIAELIIWKGDRVQEGIDYLNSVLSNGRPLECGPWPATMNLVAATYGGGSKIVDAVTGVIWRTNKAMSFEFPMVSVWNLDHDIFQQQGNAGEWMVSDAYTHCYWLRWRQSDHGWRTLFRGSSDHALIVRHASRELGMYSNRNGGWRGTGKSLDISTWNFVCGVGKAKTHAHWEGTTTVYVATDKDRELKQFGNPLPRVASGTFVYRIGWGGQGPGKLAAVRGFDRALGLAEMKRVMSDTLHAIKGRGRSCCDNVKIIGHKHCVWCGDPHVTQYWDGGGHFHPRSPGYDWVIKNNYMWIQWKIGPRWPSVTMRMAFSGIFLQGNIFLVGNKEQDYRGNHWHGYAFFWNGVNTQQSQSASRYDGLMTPRLQGGMHTGQRTVVYVVFPLSTNFYCQQYYWGHHNMWYMGWNRIISGIPVDGGSTRGFCKRNDEISIGSGSADDLFSKNKKFDFSLLGARDGVDGDGDGAGRTDAEKEAHNEALKRACNDEWQVKAIEACAELKPEQEDAPKEDWDQYYECMYDVCESQDVGIAKEHIQDAKKAKEENIKDKVVTYVSANSSADCPENYTAANATSEAERKKIKETLDAAGANKRVCEPKDREFSECLAVKRSGLHEETTCGQGMRPSMPKTAAELAKVKSWALANKEDLDLTDLVWLGGSYKGDGGKWSWDDGSDIEVFGQTPTPKTPSDDNYVCMNLTGNSGALVPCEVDVDEESLAAICETKFQVELVEEQKEEEGEDNGGDDGGMD
eukprot:TRINITY_DN1162_c3_g1_i1.p1 TRINITY_DN1162_c3_g1~~TRINITY_DN1162_c3_g1_i1.p1  ORF type:complete len:1641 (+),score=259.95 TRINITY_DN1162_c3_g1_i1:684-4925(+)